MRSPGDEESFQETVQQLTRDHRELIDAEYALVVDGGGGVLDDSGAAIQFQVGFAEKTYATFAMTAKIPVATVPCRAAIMRSMTWPAPFSGWKPHTFPVETNEITLTYFARTAPFLNNEVGDAMARLVADTRDAEAIATLRAQPQYVGTLGTTCIPTMLSGRARRKRAAPSGHRSGELPYFPRPHPLGDPANCSGHGLTPTSSGALSACL